ncbi:MAG: S41 family peptidase [Bacteroidaceae bacterium]|nr:S41 family peptidase [Bacteroidaceae bacterium]
MNRQNNKYVPLMVAVGIVVGILIGSFYANHFSGNKVGVFTSSSNKINDLLRLVDDYYVDTVDIGALVEKSIPKILQELDPHSTYTGPKEAEAAMQGLKGSFSGIGVRFTISDDTVCIVRVIEGGPSERAGLQAGDRIIAVDGRAYTGEKVNNDTTMALLKGPKDTKVALTLWRPLEARRIKATVTRGDVPLKSVDAAYMLDDATAYIRVGNFAETTYREFLVAMATLRKDGMKSLIIDLRGNFGGYMSPAVQIANEFLPKKKLIVYTQGRTMPREDYHSDGRGSFTTLPLVVLVDETSASASEILAGALQDNDRATIVGRRTFGKGLVQVPIEFNDGSMVRLTKARYYTPSGRCVQKPYTPGDEEDYEKDLVLREVSGEYYSPDSIRHSEETFSTVGGRTVYGGGGIIPEIFTPRDTTAFTPYLREAVMLGLTGRFAFKYVDSRRREFARFNSSDDLLRHISPQALLNQFVAFAEADSLPANTNHIARSRDLLLQYLTSGILNDLYDTQEAVRFVNSNDPAVRRALEVIREGRAFPLEGETKKAAAQAQFPAAVSYSRWSAMGWGAMASLPTVSYYAPWQQPLAVCFYKQRWTKPHCAGTYVR